MHNQACNIPAFLNKLKLLVDDPKTDELIYWDAGGRSFHIRDGNRLAKDVLPMLFKHNNLSSFIRQLNMYGFRKINRADSVVGFTSDNEDMEFSHPYFQRNNINLLSKIHRKPPSYNFAANLLNSNLSTSSPVSISTVRDHVAANGGNRIVFGAEFNRLAEAVRQMRARQESTTQQMHILRAENQFMYRQISQLRNQLDKQGQLIQTLFNFLSAIASDRRNSSIRISSGKRKLALTGAPAVDEEPSCLAYNLDPMMLSEKTRLVAANPQIKRVIFSQAQDAIAASAPESSEMLSRCNSPRVEVIANPSTSTPVLSQSAPILAIQDVTPARKRTRRGSQDVFSFTSDLLDTLSAESSNDVVEEVNSSKSFDEETQCFDDGFEQACKLLPSDYHLSEIVPSISSHIEDFSEPFIGNQESEPSSHLELIGERGKNNRVAVPRRRTPFRRLTVSAPAKSAPNLSGSPMLTNINKEENASLLYTSEKVGLLPSDNSTRNCSQISASPEDVEEHFPWDHGTDQPDGALINDIVSMAQDCEGGHENGDVENMDDVVANFMLSPSLGQNDQDDIFENLFAISPLKSLTPPMVSPNRDTNDAASES